MYISLLSSPTYRYSPASSWNSDAPPPTNVPWEVFSFIEHRIDSSSCHIYTALWANLPVVIKLIKAERVQVSAM